MRVAFMGSPDFAVPSLERLLADGHAVSLVVTQPDRPAGRGQALRPPAVKTAALRAGLALLQPERLADPAILAALRAARPDAIVVVAFGQFLPRAVRELPPQGCLNVHASLLPRYRGAAPIARAIMAGDVETGVTIMRVEARMDAGPTLLRRVCAIHPDDDAGSLHDRLAPLGAEALGTALDLLARGQAAWLPQDEGLATSAPKLTDADCRLDLGRESQRLANQVRGLSPAPGAHLALDGGRRLKVLRAAPRPLAGLPGVVLAVEDGALVVGAGGGALALLEVQPQGKRRMAGAEYARGRRLGVGAACD
jgi:methionyl-tRNA formyltransferase